MAPASADRAALTGKASRGNLTQPPKRCLSCGRRAIPFISQLRALRPSSREEEEARREEGGGEKKKRKTCKSRPGVARMNTTGEFLRQRRSEERSSFGFLLLIRHRNESQAGLEACDSRLLCSLTVACEPLSALLFSGGEVMCATCAIMSSTEFGHGLVKAEPGYPFSVRSSKRRALQLKGLGRMNERG